MNFVPFPIVSNTREPINLRCQLYFYKKIRRCWNHFVLSFENNFRYLLWINNFDVLTKEADGPRHLRSRDDGSFTIATHSPCCYGVGPALIKMNIRTFARHSAHRLRERTWASSKPRRQKKIKLLALGEKNLKANILLKRSESMRTFEEWSGVFFVEL